ncbi:hypothetical protein PM8797T_16810 [Gimesia maris DSM 8797]|uniref:Uncharacterized protein n=1 Tax=Gimesia maris TaxID=122 RepID=A0ABX5YIW6_9PLAN|nr:hypothetical protein PM8797T_16810 [Gimesia maris DSM 8797]QEG15574.1 hypothetical protein GmarT_14150 [Gimesia maris]
MQTQAADLAIFFICLLLGGYYCLKYVMRSQGFRTGFWTGFWTRIFIGTLRSSTGSGFLEKIFKTFLFIFVLLLLLAFMNLRK